MGQSTRVAVLVVLALAIACVGAPVASAYVYWANGSTITRANTDASGTPNASFIPASGSSGVAVDGAYVYWAAGVTIGRARLDGTGTPSPSFITGLNAADAVAVDGSHIYWADAGNASVGRANLDGSGVVDDFIHAANTVNGVAVDGSHIYWANFGESIGRANLDGTDVVQNFISTASNVIGVAVDSAHIYWASAAPSLIGRANLDGSGIQTSFIPDTRSPDSIAVDGAHIYWTNQTDGTIGRANIDGTGVTQSFFSGGAGRGIAVDGLPSGSLSASPASLAFGSQPLGLFSPPRAVTIADDKFGTLALGRASLIGNSDDFLISSDGCSLATQWIGDSCTIGIRFGPSAGGSRAATLSIPSDDPAGPLTVGLSGTGGSLPQGPQGPPGPQGLQGPPGPPGRVELVRCSTATKTVVKKVHGKRTKKKVMTQKCTTSLVSTPVRFTITGKAVTASLDRGGGVYASGRATRNGALVELIASGDRAIATGRYVLELGTGRATRRRVVIIR